ncbi:MAG: hypothetical protein JO316_14030 [Abitibacteriaceae bacterium]|nr:hypothetical protein [Abditibacteriaceae bacterium]
MPEHDRHFMDSTEKSLLPEADLHCHLLPAWDDGPRTLEESLQMATKAVASGLKAILVTPHVGRPLSSVVERPGRDIPAATAHLEQEMRSHGIDITLIAGAELTLTSPDLAKQITQEPWLTVGGQGRYVLVESTFGCWPRYADQLLYEISLTGNTPIIAHPERLPDVQKDINTLRNVVERGALLQLTARSLMGADDRRTKQCSYDLLEAGMVGLIASDAHSMKSVLPAEVTSLVQKATGDTIAQRILIDNPRAVLNGESISPLLIESGGTKSRKLWSLKRLWT